MSEIPDDILEAALKCADKVCCNLHYDDVSLEVEATARAILAERKRCAGLAEKIVGEACGVDFGLVDSILSGEQP